MVCLRRLVVVRHTLYHSGVLLSDKLEKSRAALGEYPTCQCMYETQRRQNSHRVFAQSNENRRHARILLVSSARIFGVQLTIADPTAKEHCIPTKKLTSTMGLISVWPEVSQAQHSRSVSAVGVVARVGDWGQMWTSRCLSTHIVGRGKRRDRRGNRSGKLPKE